MASVDLSRGSPRRSAPSSAASGEHRAPSDWTPAGMGEAGPGDHQAQLEMVMKDNEQLLRECELFSNYLTRVAPQLAQQSEEEEARGRRKARKARDFKSAALSWDQKLEMAARELEEIRDEIVRTKAASEKSLDNMRAVMEETEIAITETKKDAYEFKRDIEVGAENTRTGKIIAEKVIRYNEDKIRAKEALIEKLRLKNTTLKTQILKLESQLEAKEEMGEVLHAIDFEQLKIENRQFLDKIEERNNELLRLKLTAGNTVQVLNSYKKKLNTLTSEQAWLKSEIKLREDALAKIADEIGRVTDEREQAQKVNSRLVQQQEEYRVPMVLDYVVQKAEMYELEKKLKDWERKCEIATMEANRPAAATRRTTAPYSR